MANNFLFYAFRFIRGFDHFFELKSSYQSVLCFSLCSMLLDKKFKSEQVRLGVEAAAKLGTRSNRYETLLKQRHVQVSESRPFLCPLCSVLS